MYIIFKYINQISNVNISLLFKKNSDFFKQSALCLCSFIMKLASYATKLGMITYS